MSIGNKLRGLRESSGYTSKQVSEFININPSTYSKLENDKKSIDIDELRALTKLYNISADEILGTDEEEDIIKYMKKDKFLNDDEIKEVQMIIEMMDEATVLLEILKR